MEKNKKIYYTIKVNNLIALCHIIDEFNEFNQNVIKFINEINYTPEYLFKLEKLSKGKKYFFSRKIKKFYRKNKHTIDTINEYTNIAMFIVQNYISGYGTQINFFYEYLLKNKDKLEEILAVLEKIKSLGFKEIELNEDIDFTIENHSISKRYYHNAFIAYLDNLTAIPGYEKTEIKYKTTSSSYKMILENLHSYIHKRIILNSLTFDANELPDDITYKEIHNKLLELPKEREKEYNAIRTSVDLSVGIEDFLSAFNELNKRINSINNISKKEELFELLRSIKEEILKMQTITSEYDKEIASTNEYVSEELLTEEKKSYQRRREYSKLDLD